MGGKEPDSPEAEPCVICQDNDADYPLPCNHKFCIGCLQRQVRTGQGANWNKCPNCRRAIFNKDARRNAIPAEFWEANDARIVNKRNEQLKQDRDVIRVIFPEKSDSSCDREIQRQARPMEGLVYPM